MTSTTTCTNSTGKSSKNHPEDLIFPRAKRRTSSWWKTSKNREKSSPETSNMISTSSTWWRRTTWTTQWKGRNSKRFQSPSLLRSRGSCLKSRRNLRIKRSTSTPSKWSEVEREFPFSSKAWDRYSTLSHQEHWTQASRAPEDVL